LESTKFSKFFRGSVSDLSGEEVFEDPIWQLTPTT
jgi:hypothetical protein